MRFKVVDTLTGKAPDLRQIALTEEWAKGLVWLDVEGFAITEHGELLLFDSCGYFRYCPKARFDWYWSEAK